MPAHLTILSPRDYRLQELTAPAGEPVDLEDMKAHLRLTGSEGDAEVVTLTAAARALCEVYTGKVLLTRSIAIFLDSWPHTRNTAWWDGVREGAVGGEGHAVRLPVSPVQSVDMIYVHSQDGGAWTLTADHYTYETIGGRLSLSGVDMGNLRMMNAIEIRVTAGYGDAAAVPSVYKQAIRQLTAHLYTHRGDSGDLALSRCGAAALLAPFREVSLR